MCPLEANDGPTAPAGARSLIGFDSTLISSLQRLAAGPALFHAFIVSDELTTSRPPQAVQDLAALPGQPVDELFSPSFGSNPVTKEGTSRD